MPASLISPTFSADHEQRLHFYKTSIFPICKWCSSNLFDGEIWFVKTCFYNLILDLPLGILSDIWTKYPNIYILFLWEFIFINSTNTLECFEIFRKLEASYVPSLSLVEGKNKLYPWLSWTKMRRMHHLSLLAGMLSC